MRPETTLCDRRRFLSRCLGGIAATGIAAATLRAGQSEGDQVGQLLTEIAGAAKRDGADALWDLVRKQFSLESGLIYLNNGGLGPSPGIVVETLIRETRALERVSESGHARVAGVRQKAARFVGCNEDEIALTRNATGGMNAVARGLPLKPGDEVLLSTHEHPGGAMPWLALAERGGVKVKLFEPGGRPSETLERIENALTPRTRVVSVSHVTCTTGLRLPARGIARLCRAKSVISVFDGAQAVGQIPVNIHEIGCDFYVASGHKWLLGPKGTGLLFISPTMHEAWQPTYVGAYSDREYDLDRGVLELLPGARAVEYGTRNTPVALAFGAALDFLDAIGMERVAGRGQALAARLKQSLRSIGAYEILTPDDVQSSGSIVTFRLKDGAMDPRKWCSRLKKEHGIRVRPVGEHGLNAVRVSMHIYNSFEQIDRLAAVLTDMVNS